MATNIQWRPPVAANELSTSGHITHFLSSLPFFSQPKARQSHTLNLPVFSGSAPTSGKCPTRPTDSVLSPFGISCLSVLHATTCNTPAACCALVEAPTSLCLRMKVAVSLKPTRTCAFASINTTIIFFSTFRILPTPAQQTSKAPMVHNNADGLYRYTFTALARGRAETGERSRWGMPTRSEPHSAGCKAFLTTNSVQRKKCIWCLTLMTENSLCRITRVAGDKDDEFKV
ncbi:hypothetical protein DFH06DRAFT_1408625 [Mycena polygramma]|nr:hypothetical protein DFH06DRAFT_1408625 [Mycena polygramma]